MCSRFELVVWIVADRVVFYWCHRSSKIKEHRSKKFYGDRSKRIEVTDLVKARAKEVPISEGSSVTTTETYMENYKNVSQDIRDQLNAEAEAQNEINEIRAERIACTANPLALVAQQQPVYHPQNHPTHYTQNSSTRSQQAATRNIEKAIVNSPQPIYDQEPSMVVEDDETSKDKEIDKLMVLISLSIARAANSLALVAQKQPVYHPQNHPTHYTQNYSTRSQQAATRNKGKAIVNSPLPIYDQEPSMVDEDDKMSKDKEIDKLVVLISLSFKKIYKPTNNNLRTSSNTSRANQDNSPRINRGAGYANQRLCDVAGARETVGTTVVQKSRIQCYICEDFGHVARECQKLKRAKDAAYHREKMLLGKQLEAGIQLNA
nr:hypothetical protein [Tanacetum cinerariifolium]